MYSYEDWPTYGGPVAHVDGVDAYTLSHLSGLTRWLDAYVVIRGGGVAAVKEPMTAFSGPSRRNLHRVLSAGSVDIEARGPDADSAVKVIRLFLEGNPILHKLNRLRAIYESNKERGGPALVPYPGKDRPVVSRTPDGSLTATAVVKDPEGMHCRAWAVIREFLQERDATITIRWRGRTATLTGRTVYPGFSIVRRLLDPVKCGDEMSVTVEGPDAAEVMEAMLLITQRGGYRKVLRSEYVRKRRAGATG